MSWKFIKMNSFRGVQPFGISGPRWKKSLGPHIKYTNTNKNWWAKKTILSKFMILCWAAFIPILGYMWPTGHRLDTPVYLYYLKDILIIWFIYIYRTELNWKKYMKVHAPNTFRRCTMSMSVARKSKIISMILSYLWIFLFPTLNNATSLTSKCSFNAGNNDVQ